MRVETRHVSAPMVTIEQTISRIVSIVSNVHWTDLESLNVGILWEIKMKTISFATALSKYPLSSGTTEQSYQ